MPDIAPRVAARSAGACANTALLAVARIDPVESDPRARQRFLGRLRRPSVRIATRPTAPAAAYRRG